MSALHLTEVAIALNVMSAGGSFVLKMFTLFEPQSRAMMLLLAAVFDQVCRRMFKKVIPTRVIFQRSQILAHFFTRC